ncbi:MAG: PEGA domain-containing protein, partial [Deltaproteobacteria bacterium]|nr:PEGA domain-containing protein [Deltaproteobacteria bacterium]
MAKGRSPAVPTRFDSPLGRPLAGLIALVLALTSGAGLFTRPAQASDLPRVLVLPYARIYGELPAKIGDKTGEVLANELKSSEQLQLALPKQDAAAAAVAAKPVNPAPPKDASALAEAKERSSKADEAVKKLKFKQAVDELERVVAILEVQHPYIDFAELVNAYLTLAVSYFRRGQDSDGEKILAQVVRLDPERKLDAEKYPPVFLRTFDNVSRKVKKASRATIQVEPTSAGATVFLDGRQVGKAPLLLKDVIKGAHFLRVVPASGGEAWADRVDAPQGDSIKVVPDLGGGPLGPVPELLGLLARNTIDEVVVTKATALATANNADYLVLGGVHKEGENIVVSSHLFKVASRKSCLLQRVTFDAEMLGAGIEIYKVGADVANKVEVFGDEEKLPAKVARDALPPAGYSAPIATVSLTTTAGTRDAVKRVAVAVAPVQDVE